VFTAFFLTAALGRVGLAMTPLSLLWFVHSRTGSWAVAGTAVAGLALAEGLLGPVTGRFVDRFGQTRVLPLLAAAHTGALLVVLTSAPAGAPGAFALGAAAGATLPQLGACSAARWSYRLDGDRLARAFGQEALANSTAFVAAPLLVGLLAGGTPLLLAGGLTVGGTLVLATLRSSAPPAHPGPAGFALPRGVSRPLVVNALVGAHFGALPLAVTVAADTTGWATWLLAASSAGGLVGGLLLTRWTVPPGRAALLLAVPACLLPLPWPGPGLAVVLFVLGGTVPLVAVAASLRARRRTAPQHLTSTFAWLASCSAAGSALGASVGGALVETSGSVAGFTLAAFCAAAVLLTEKIRR
jgi:hypothetical protein